jgi:hypothetical protein
VAHTVGDVGQGVDELGEVEGDHIVLLAEAGIGYCQLRFIRTLIALKIS